MGLLERYCDILSEGKLSDSAAQLGQDCLEAISGILATASRIDSPELHTLSHSLAQRYPALLEEAELRENVSLKLLPHLNPGRPSQTSVDAKIVVIAQSHGQVAWSPPGLLPEDRQKLFITMLKSTPADTETIDLGKLRQLCCYSIPSTAPAWLRLRAWSILLGVLPLDRRKWHHSAKRARADYLALSQQVLATLSSAPPPLDGSSTLSTQDKALVQFSKDVEALPGSIRDALLHCTVPSEPASTDDSQDARHTDAVLSRIHVIKNRNRSAAGSTQITPLIPTITLDDPPTSPFSPTAFYTSQEPSPPVPTILLSSSSTSINILLRLLYIHSMLHSSHATSLGPPSSLAAIFAVILTLALQAQATPSETLLSPVEETNKAEPLDPLIQIEADVFWMVEAIVGNTRELLDGGEEGDEIWSRRFSNVVRWADNELWMDLVSPNRIV
ncbi:hypothetical protein M408DRAFT_235890 [Serendipita vermifera MAFF 305830]|uniref:Rab-GAP TBC domain-containing protein n=1 Tax=Serendipita vermifera MAFF 305830 TaxID=933852 RepID=A0A0C3BHQ6_SERVB|nr:hypothetical protein M408DRAFT_235890 [Serendipita vermifera MAFF 305830]